MTANTVRNRFPLVIKRGGNAVTIYRTKSASGYESYQVADYSSGKRRLRSFSDLGEARREAELIATKRASPDASVLELRSEDRSSYLRALELLEPTGASLEVACALFAEATKLVGDSPSVVAAAKFYAVRHKRAVPRNVVDVISELLVIKESRGASRRYMEDLRNRLNRFAGSFSKDACNVTTAEIQEWLDGQKFSAQGYTDFRIRLNTLFNFAVARGYASDNPVAGVEKVKVRRGEIEVFTPAEIAKLLGAASSDFLPSLAIGAFAGLRSAEIERLEWSDLNLVKRFIVVGRNKAKTAGRRVVPVSDNLAAWLAPYAGKEGNVWPGTHDGFYHDAQQGTAEAAGVTWKSNALRHSYASYRFALTGDAGRVAGELGNSVAVVHAHYRELVQLSDAQAWFAITPESAPNVVPLQTSA